MSERIQKVLAQLGVASRREVERWINDSKVFVNGRIAKLGEHVNPGDQIRANGRLITIPQPEEQKKKLRVLLYHKPVGEICTRKDPEGRPTIFEKLPRLKQERWITVGRLDINSSGLLLLTNNGELANRLMHPSYEIDREYAVRVLGEVTQETIRALLKGVELDDGKANFDRIKFAGSSGANAWYHVILKRGKYREVRRLWESRGVTVSRLIRIRFGNITLPRALPAGKFTDLSDNQIKELQKTVDFYD